MISRGLTRLSLLSLSFSRPPLWNQLVYSAQDAVNAANGKKPSTPPNGVSSRRGSGEIFIPGVLPEAPDKGATPCLGFDSLFESGNLSKAIRLTDTEYDLLLAGDSNSR